MGDSTPTELSPPSAAEIAAIADRIDMHLDDEEIEAVAAVAEGMIGAFERLDQLDEPTPSVDYPDRDAGERVSSADDPLNAWITACEVPGADAGPLAGYEIGLKDNVSVADVELTLGSSMVAGYVPEIDATIVTRLLDAGATITGKLNMEALALSASGELSDFGPCLNPRSTDHLAGGSSSGSAAAVVAGDVDVAIGTDQAGSIRIPASWSGCVGLKPTHTLVPYTGIGALGHTFDHVGPMTTTVADAGIVLEAIAGKDPLDPRQGAVPTQAYADAATDPRDPSALTVGVVEQGFGRDESDPAVDETVRDALGALEAAGATVEEVSVPLHRDGEAIFLGFATQETTDLFRSEGVGAFGTGFYDTAFAAAFGQGRREHGDTYPPFPKVEMVMGTYLKETYFGRYHARAQNLRRSLTSAYDEALGEYDVLAMPTTPMAAHEVVDDPSFLEGLDRAADMLGNTAPFDATGHPAINVPCGDAAGLPVGLQFVGEHFDDAAVLSAAATFEDAVGWDL
ncbi:amidase [Halovivax gelatinilyticus]|uniref:amidase n=1 Tax=Halovivax gelatinilyticus TaxID=2961597 RepID=UPI0020CA32DD|nr:amidase [Halovivax gelatinilyticus]